MILILLGSLSVASAADAISGSVVKVLPLFLDLKGHDAVSPSLFDRDAYQFHLRQHTNEISAVRFDVLWKAAKAPQETIKITVELRGIGTNSIPTLHTMETNVVPGTFRKWTAIPLAGDDYRRLGRVIAWRVTLWGGQQRLGAENSFLW